MGVEITPQFLFEYERRMRVNQERQYSKLVMAKNYWANKVLRPLKIEGRTERVTWLLETAMIRPIGPSGSGGMTFQNLVSATVEYTSFKHGHGIRVQRDQLEDLDGDGLNQLMGWATQVGAQIGYYPQKLCAQLILNGANTDGSANAYDGLPFFMDNTVGTGNANPGNTYSNGHYYNPYNAGLGGYYSWLHGAAVASSAGVQAYPGALPIDDSVSVETALINLGKAIAYLATVKQANGQDPRFFSRPTSSLRRGWLLESTSSCKRGSSRRPARAGRAPAMSPRRLRASDLVVRSSHPSSARTFPTRRRCLSFRRARRARAARCSSRRKLSRGPTRRTTS